MADYTTRYGLDATELFTELQRIKAAYSELLAIAQKSGISLSESLNNAASASGKMVSETIKATNQIQAQGTAVKNDAAQIQDFINQLAKVQGGNAKAFDATQLNKFFSTLKAGTINITDFAAKAAESFDTSKVVAFNEQLQNSKGNFDDLRLTLQFIKENISDLKLDSSGSQQLLSQIEVLEQALSSAAQRASEIGVNLNNPQAITALTNLQNETNKSDVDFNQLNAAIKNAKTVLDTLPADAPEFNTLSGAIQNATNVLNENAVSVDQLKIKLQNLQATAGAEKDVTALTNLNRQIEQTKTEITQLENIGKAGFDNLGNKISAVEPRAQRITTRIREITNEIASMQEKSGPRFQSLVTEAAFLQDELADTRQQIQLLSSDTAKIDILVQGVQGLVGVFAAAQGVIALVGTEDEELQKTLLKVNAAMAILQGFQSVGNLLDKNSAFNKGILVLLQKQQAAASAEHAISSQKEVITQEELNVAEGEGIVVTEGLTTAQQGLNTAMELNPAGILLLSIGALVGLYTIWQGSISKTTELIEEQTAAQLKLNQQLDFNKKFNDEEIENLKQSGAEKLALMKGQGASEQALRDEERKQLELQISEFDKNNKAAIDAGEAAATQIDNIRKGLQKIADESEGRSTVESLISPEIQKQLETLQATADKGLSIQKERNRIESELNIKRLDNIASTNKEVDSKQKEANDKAKGDYDKSIQLLAAYNSAFASLQKQIRDIAIQQLPSEREQQKAQLRAQFDDQVSIINKTLAEQRKAGFDTKAIEEAAAKDREALRNKLNADLLNIDVDFYKQQKNLIQAANDAINKISADQTQLQVEQTKKQFDDLIASLEEANQKILSQKSIEPRDLSALQENNNEIIKLEQAREAAVNKIVHDAALARLDTQEQLATDTIDSIRIEGLTEEQLTQLKEEKKLEIEQEFAQKRFDLLTNTFRAEGKLTDQQITDLQDRLNLAHAAERGEDIFTFLGINISDADKEKLQPVIKAINDTGGALANLKAQGDKGILSGILDAVTKGLDTQKVQQAQQLLKDSLNSIGESFKGIFDNLTAIAEENAKKQSDAIQTVIDALDDQISQQEDVVDQQKELSDKGLANDLRNQQAILDDLKAKKVEEINEREKAQAAFEKIQKRNALIQAAGIIATNIESAVNMINAATKIYGSFAAIPLGIGIPIAGAIIAGLFAAFTSIKKAFTAAATEGFPKLRHGGGKDIRGELLEGPSHENKGIGLYDERSGRKLAEYEGNEYLFAIKRESVSKHKPLLEAINKDILPASHYEIINTILTTGRMPVERIERVTLLQKEVQVLKIEHEQHTKKELVELREEVKEFRKNVNEHHSSEVKRIDMGDHILEKGNGYTRRIKKKPTN